MSCTCLSPPTAELPWSGGVRRWRCIKTYSHCFSAQRQEKEKQQMISWKAEGYRADDASQPTHKSAGGSGCTFPLWHRHPVQVGPLNCKWFIYVIVFDTTTRTKVCWCVFFFLLFFLRAEHGLSSVSLPELRPNSGVCTVIILKTTFVTIYSIHVQIIKCEKCMKLKNNFSPLCRV